MLIVFLIGLSAGFLFGWIMCSIFTVGKQADEMIRQQPKKYTPNGENWAE